jgi:threonine/homoserine/homoserine lactone efflux protein
MYSYLFKGLMLGFTAGVQPGPYQTYVISQSLLNGWRRTLIAAFAPLVSDLPIVLLVLFVLTRIPNWLLHTLYVAGGIFVLFLAWRAFNQWRHFTGEESTPSGSNQKSLLQAAMMNILSPGPYLFWSLVNGPLLLQAWAESPGQAIVFLLAFYSAMIGMNAAIIILSSIAGGIGERVRRTMIGISALALTGFGVYQLWLGLAG